MKRLIPFLLIGIFLLLSPNETFAADALYRMLHADECEDFKKDQDALIIGQLIDKNNDMFTVNVCKVMSGTLSSDYISVHADFKYGYPNSELKQDDVSLNPKVYDYCVMSLKKTGTSYKNAWGIFKATSGDFNTLKLLSDDIKYPYWVGDIAAIEWYINSGGTENNFFFTGDTVFVTRPNGEKVQVYSKENIGIDTSKEELSSSSAPGSRFPYGKYFTTLALAFLLFLLTILFLARNKRF